MATAVGNRLEIDATDILILMLSAHPDGSRFSNLDDQVANAIQGDEILRSRFTVNKYGVCEETDKALNFLFLGGTVGRNGKGTSILLNGFGNYAQRVRGRYDESQVDYLVGAGMNLVPN